MQINIKKIMHTIESVREINGKCSGEDYQNLVNVFFIYNIILFPLNFIFVRSSSIIMLVILPIFFLYSEVIFILTSIRRLNALDYKVWWILFYILFRAIYLYFLKLGESLFSADFIISLFVTLAFILCLSFRDGFDSLTSFFKNIKDSNSFEKYNTQTKELNLDVDVNKSNYSTAFTILCSILIYVLFIPADLKIKINNTISSSFERLIFEITKLDDRIIMGKSIFSQGYKTATSEIDTPDAETIESDEVKNTKDSYEIEEPTSSEIKVKTEIIDHSDSGIAYILKAISIQALVDDVKIQEVKANRGHCSALPEIASMLPGILLFEKSPEKIIEIKNQIKQWTEEYNANPLKFGEIKQYIINDDCNLVEINVKTTRGDYKVKVE